ncbi:SPFH domain-containing protein [Aeromonas phage vB_AsaP_MQM1]|nr:SPFH domain-containing protein [Aeromonas phage vB_AsaP_MQM1]
MNSLTKITAACSVIGTLIIGGFIFGGFHSVKMGEYHIVKSVNGPVSVKSEPGWYVNYGDETVWPQYMTYDFGGDVNASADMTTSPLGVKYAEGGLGTIKGNIQVQLPMDDENRLLIHRKFGRPAAFISQLVQNTTGEAMSFTAGFMESQEAYMTQRALFRSYAKDQLTKGLYSTTQERTERTDDKGNTEVTIKAIPRLDKDGNYVRSDVSPFAQFGVTVTQFNIQDWDFEQATMERIAEKRDAENKAITSRARTETAEQEKKEAIALAAKLKAETEGKAQAEASVLIVNAKRDKELAVIGAQKQVEQAAQLKLQREQELQAARLEAQSIEVMSKAEADAADRKIKAGGTLSAEQQTAIQVNQVWAQAYQNATRPGVVVAGGNGSQAGELTGTAIDQFMNAVTAGKALEMAKHK